MTGASRNALMPRRQAGVQDAYSSVGSCVRKELQTRIDATFKLIIGTNSKAGTDRIRTK